MFVNSSTSSGALLPTDPRRHNPGRGQCTTSVCGELWERCSLTVPRLESISDRIRSLFSLTYGARLLYGTVERLQAAYVALHGLHLDYVYVDTQDHWVLGVHRVRNLKIFDEKLSTPVLLAHGFGCSSIDYIMNPRNESLAFILADHGYDVWMLNFRSNRYSAKVRRNGEVTKPQPKDYYRARLE